MVCINPAYRLYELEYALNKVGCVAIVSAESFKSSKYLKMLATLAPELNSCEAGELKSEKLPHLKHVICMGEEKTNGMHNFSDIKTLSEGQDPQKLEAIAEIFNADDIINIQFTRGTTGQPKGAALSHHNILNNAFYTATSMHLTHQDTLCIPVPLYHCFGMVLGTLCCISVGAKMVFPAEVFDPVKTMEAASAEKCTALHGEPTMFFTELDLPILKDYGLPALRTGIIAGATCPEELMKRLISQMGLKQFVIGDGQTECSPINTATAIEDSFEVRTSTVGRAHYNWEQKKLGAKNSPRRWHNCQLW